MLADLNRDVVTAVLYIPHDLQSVASSCQRIAILHDGELVECGPTAGVLQSPRHPFTKRLAAYVPWLHFDMKTREATGWQLLSCDIATRTSPDEPIRN
jgi:ABC-type dipeptide/oligopeptide/nickel transport system ATPase component